MRSLVRKYKNRKHVKAVQEAVILPEVMVLMDETNLVGSIGIAMRDGFTINVVTWADGSNMAPTLYWESAIGMSGRVEINGEHSVYFGGLS